MTTLNVPDRINLSYLKGASDEVLQTLKAKWTPEKGDVVYDGEIEFPLTSEIINSESFDKLSYIPLLSTMKAYNMIIKNHYIESFGDVSYNNMDDKIAKILIASIERELKSRHKL